MFLSSGIVVWRSFLCGAGLLLEEVVSEEVVCESSVTVFVYSSNSCCWLSDSVVVIGWPVVLNFGRIFVSWMYVKGGG